MRRLKHNWSTTRQALHACLALLAWLLAGCLPPNLAAAPTLPATATLAASVPSATSPAPSATPTRLSTATATPSPTAEPRLCSPLDGISLEELPGIVTNPYDPPRPGLDDGHQGVDFSFWHYRDIPVMKDLPVRAALTGRVAGVTLDRYPYGNMLIIETSLDELPAGTDLEIPPAVQATLAPDQIRLTCSGEDTQPQWREDRDPGQRSLYLLYAHLDQAPLPAVGDRVACGQTIGAVGSTGASVNDHLHFEVRVGPAGAVFPGMAHYITDASPDEEAAFCAWRVSGLFTMLDPLQLLAPDAASTPLPYP